MLQSMGVRSQTRLSLMVKATEINFSHLFNFSSPKLSLHPPPPHHEMLSTRSSNDFKRSSVGVRRQMRIGQNV